MLHAFCFIKRGKFSKSCVTNKSSKNKKASHPTVLISDYATASKADWSQLRIYLINNNLIKCPCTLKPTIQ